jgi:hypothetical protein
MWKRKNTAVILYKIQWTIRKSFACRSPEHFAQNELIYLTILDILPKGLALLGPI